MDYNTITEQAHNIYYQPILSTVILMRWFYFEEWAMDNKNLCIFRFLLVSIRTRKVDNIIATDPCYNH